MKETISSQIAKLVTSETRVSPDLSPEQITDRLLERNRKLFDEWLRENCSRLVQIEKRKAERPPDPYQMFFPGFRDLKETISLPVGRVALGDASITQLRKSLSRERVRKGPKARKLESLIEAMAPYAKMRYGLTVQRYCELVAAGESPNPKPVKKRSHKRRSDEDDEV